MNIEDDLDRLRVLLAESSFGEQTAQRLRARTAKHDAVRAVDRANAVLGPADTGLIDPVHRTILAVDIERSAARTNLIKLDLRREMYRLLGEAMAKAGIQRFCEPLIDRGDGVLALIHPVDEVPQSRLLTVLVPELARRLTVRNAGLEPDERTEQTLRLRVVVHAGDILRDSYGPFGAELDVAFRLLDARPVKQSLRETAAPLVLVISEQIYQSVVIHRYGDIHPESFRRAVHVRVCGLHRFGRIHVPQADPRSTVLREINQSTA